MLLKKSDAKLQILTETTAILYKKIRLAADFF